VCPFSECDVWLTRDTALSEPPPRSQASPWSSCSQLYGPSYAHDTMVVPHRNSNNKRLKVHGDVVEHQACPSNWACGRRLSMGNNAGAAPASSKHTGTSVWAGHKVRPRSGKPAGQCPNIREIP
jgi:hypothetical protein